MTSKLKSNNAKLKGLVLQVSLVTAVINFALICIFRIVPGRGGTWGLEGLEGGFWGVGGAS